MAILKATSTILLSLLMLPSLLSVGKINAAEVEVNWLNSDKYRDVHAGEGHRAKFKTNTFKQLEQHFEKLAKKLPEGYQLIINVNDLDLAGDVHHGGIRQIRIVKSIYYPRMKFSYQLLSSSQAQLLSADVNLRDMSFMEHVALKYKQQTLGYEKQMLDDWFYETFRQYL